MKLLTAIPGHNHGPEYYLLMGALALVVIVSIIITKGLAFRYLLDQQLNKWIKNSVAVLHFGVSLVIATYLPNNILNHEDYFAHLFEKNGLMIPLSMLIMAIFLFTLIGIIISIITKSSPPNRDTIDHN